MSPPQVSPRAQAAEAVVQAWLASSGVEYESGRRPGEHVVQLPGEAKLRTTASLLVGERGVSVAAFVVRRPDENEAEFYRWMLTRNARIPGVAFALDRLGDVYLIARLPLEGVIERTLDELMGTVLAVADSSFNELLALGFLTSMRREWAWREERGESLRNLEAFRHLLADPPEPADRVDPPEPADRVDLPDPADAAGHDGGVGPGH